MDSHDRALRQRVLDELDFDPSIDSCSLTVSARAGVVTLGGHVPSVMQTSAAERAAWRVKGVKAIAQDIHVRFPEDKKVNDDEIAGRAIAILDWTSAIPDGAVRVKVQDGWVTLSGQVPWNYQRTLAEYEVRKLSGVAGIVNQLTLAPVAQPADMKQRILGALRRHAELAARDISVDVRTDGSVRIVGKVDNRDEREAVEQAVWSAPGVTMVEDALQIA
ncbi:MAG TPA: BON domain-containing protein [Luteimonas sp.]|nr:BON domain-containing protein [Luteimonas sp.]